MAEIIFRPDDPEEEEYAEIYLETEACISDLQSRIDSYSIKDDKLFLEWVEQSRDRDAIPEKHWNRARFVVDKLLGETRACKVLCRRCDMRVDLSKITTDQWDGIGPRGEFIGGAGHRFLCGKGHPLLMVWTRIY